jgi:hypothetical protein
MVLPVPPLPVMAMELISSIKISSHFSLDQPFVLHIYAAAKYNYYPLEIISIIH